MTIERHPGSISGMPDDQLGTVAVSLVIGELQWSPDVAPATLDRISRDAVAYPEQFDRRPVAPASQAPPPPPSERSAKRTVGRLAVLGVIIVAVLGLVALVTAASAAAAVPDGLQAQLVETADGFEQPLLVTHAGDGSGAIYVVEQGGRIWAVDADGERAGVPFLDLSDSVSLSFEQGLLGLAFHPAYADNGRFFVNYTRADGTTVVSEFTAAGDVADRSSERRLLLIEQPFANHNGGHLAFDAAGMLLIGTGDGGSGGDPLGAGQDPATLLGKLLRIDVDGGEPYGIPPDNGFIDDDAYLPEIHSSGLRNPWRFSVDPVGGHIYIGDVGQSAFEEVSVAPEGRGGQSFGWNEVEGPQCFTDGCDLDAHTPPAVSYGRSDGCSIVGGYVYRGTEQPGLEGVYVFGDFCGSTIWGADADELVAGEATSVPIATIDGTLVSFGVDERGELYAVDQGGRILHVVTEAP